MQSDAGPASALQPTYIELPKSLARIKRETISATDEVKINEQEKSIARGPSTGQRLLLPEDVTVLNHTGYPTW